MIGKTKNMTEKKKKKKKSKKHNQKNWKKANRNKNEKRNNSKKKTSLPNELLRPKTAMPKASQTVLKPVVNMPLFFIRQLPKTQNITNEDRLRKRLPECAQYLHLEEFVPNFATSQPTAQQQTHRAKKIDPEYASRFAYSHTPPNFQVGTVLQLNEFNSHCTRFTMFYDDG